MISEISSKIEQNLKLRIRQNALTKNLPMTERKISHFIKLFEKVNQFHFKAIEMILEKSRAKSTKKLKLRIRQNAFYAKVAYDRVKNKAFYQTF